MPRSIQISPDVSFPLSFVTNTTAVLARRGAGKSYTASVIAEQVMEAEQPVIILDPLGAFWGLRSSADGKKPGYAVIVLGGRHGDVPLEPTAGKVIANLVVEKPGWYVVDLSLFESGAAQDRFAADFLETLYRAKAAKPTAQLLIVDEADSFAPQRPGPNQLHMLGAMESIVRRGRSRGLGMLMISQRAAVLNKNVLTQSENLIVMQTTGPQDLAAIELWIEHTGNKEQRTIVLNSLPSLPVGQCWVWSPQHDMLTMTRVQKRVTFDSSATPKPGEVRVEPQKRADVDLDALGSEIKATVERAKENNPAELRAKIRRLEQELAKKPEAAVEYRCPQPYLDAVDRVKGMLVDALKIFDDKISEPEFQKRPKRIVGLTESARSDAIEKFLVKTVAVMAKRDQVNGDLPKGERAILTACAQYPEGVDRQQLTVLTGYKRSTRDAYIQRLGEKQMATPQGDRIFATEYGIKALGDFEPLPTGGALREHWLQRLPEGEKRVLLVLVKAYPDFASRELISEQSGYERSTRDAYLQRLKAKKLIVTERGAARASELLF